jgi:ubiquinone/menaquinone biosynthesis C-methylase UbiE
MPTRRRAPRLSRFFNRIGSHGWREGDYFTFSVRSPMLRCWIAAQLPEKTTRILSVGCGTGELESHFSELRHHVIGLDYSRHMLKRARASGLKLLVQADSQSLPFGGDSFDVVMFLESVGYLHLPTAFKEAKRVLGKHGRLLITTYSGNVEIHRAYAKLSLDEIALSLTVAGFRVKEHRFLNAKRSSLEEVPSDHGSTLLYISSAKQR